MNDPDYPRVRSPLFALSYPAILFCLVVYGDTTGRLENAAYAQTPAAGFAPASHVNSYEYRVDGMRDHRHVPGITATEGSFYHDSQTKTYALEVMGAPIDQDADEGNPARILLD